MRIHGDRMEDVTVIEKILRSMTPKYNYVVCSIEESKDIDALSINELQSSMLVHEQRMTCHEMEEQALKVSQETYSPGRGRGRGSFRGCGRGRGRQVSFDKLTVECYYCHELGNFQYECPQKEKEYKANVANTEEEMLLMAYVEDEGDQMSSTWYLDSGCSNHMSGSKKLFSNMDESFRYNVKLGNNSSLCVMGKGNIRIEVNGVKYCITKVFLRCKFLQEFVKNERWESNIVSHFLRRAIGEPHKYLNWCILTYVDLSTNLQQQQKKSEALVVFKKFKASVEKETGVFIRALRTDRGGEFTSNDFVHFCEKNGIHMQLTAAYLPQQNGVAERKNRTIMNMVRSMLAKMKVPKKYWPEAVNWSSHILNRCPTHAMKSVTPEEAWSGKKPQVNYFKVFGCLAYVHTPDNLITKLDDKSTKYVVLGVSEESKAYKLYNPETQKIIISKDVVFDEANGWDWNNKQEKRAGVDLEEIETMNGVEEVTSREVEDEPVGHNSPRITEASPNVSRQRRPPGWMTDYVSGNELSDNENIAQIALIGGNDPTTFDDDVKSSKWRKAMDLEIQAIEMNDTWELIDLPEGERIVGVKWIFKTKFKENGEIDKYKAKLVAKGYTQEYGIDYSKVFAPVVRHDTIRLVISLPAQNDWSIYQLDVKSAFLYGELNERVFVDQPPGYVQRGKEQKAPRAWYSSIESHFLKAGFTKCPYEHTLLVKHGKECEILIVCLYVDDLIFTGNNEDMFKEFKKSMMEEFEMTYLGKMHYFLGIEVKQTSNGVFIGQKKYAEEILKRFHMEDCNSVQNPIVPGTKLNKDVGGELVNSTHFKQIVGSLMYLTATRPDPMFVVSLISRYMESPTELHYQKAKRVLRYLKGTTDLGLFYKKETRNKKEAGGELMGFSDSNYAGDLDDKKSTSGYVFMLSSAAVSWSSKKQLVVTFSTTEVEFIAATSSACQAVWLRRLLEELCFKQDNPTVIFCDNSSAIKLSRNPIMHGRSKHIDVRFHFLRDFVKNEVIELEHCPGNIQVADILTKPLKLEAFVNMRKLLGICSSLSLN
ncbi:unnamed protein product [Prunus armeniaca]